MLRKSSKARAQRPEQGIGRQLFMGWGSLHDSHISDVKRVEPWDWRPIVAEIGTKRHRKCRNECSLLGSSGNCWGFSPLYELLATCLVLGSFSQTPTSQCVVRDNSLALDISPFLPESE